MKNTLAENLLRFGAKNLSEDVKTKLAEQAVDFKTVELANEINTLPLDKLAPYDAFVTPKKIKINGDEGYVKWDKANVIKLSDNVILIFGNRTNTTGQSVPTISVTQPNGYESYNAVSGTTDLVSLLKVLLNHNIPVNSYYNAFQNMAQLLRSYVKINTKQELDVLASTNTNYKQPVDYVIRALKIA